MSDAGDQRTDRMTHTFSEDSHETPQSSPATEIDERPPASGPTAQKPDQAGGSSQSGQSGQDDTAVLPVTPAHPAEATPAEATPAAAQPAAAQPAGATPNEAHPTVDYPAAAYPSPYPESGYSAGGDRGPAYFADDRFGVARPASPDAPTEVWPTVGDPARTSWPAAVAAPAPAPPPAFAPVAPADADPMPDRAFGQDEQVARREVGAGWGGALGLVGLAGVAGGIFALPIVHYAGGNAKDVFYGQLRHLASFAVPSGGDSTSPVGGELATIWWRYAALGSTGGAALLVLLIVTFPRVRRVFGALLFLLGVAMTAALVLVGAQTNDPQTVTVTLRYDNVRLGLNHLGLGFWVAVGGAAVLAIAGLSALMRNRP